MEYGAHYDSLIMGGSMRCSQTRISMDPVSSTTLRPCSKVTPVGDALDGAADFERVSAHVQHRHGCLATELHADPGTDSGVDEGGKNSRVPYRADGDVGERLAHHLAHASKVYGWHRAAPHQSGVRDAARRPR